MIRFSATIKKFDEKGEKTGWRYIEIPSDLAEQLKPNTKVSFLVKGKLDETNINSVSLLPMGSGSFIMALKADLRKKLHKKEGAMLVVQLEADELPYQINADFLDCLTDVPQAAANFKKLPQSHQKYFSKWIESAKTDATKAKRISQATEAMQYNLSFPDMIRKNKTSMP